MPTPFAPRPLSWLLLIPTLLMATGAARAWDTTSYRTLNGDLIRPGMSRAEIGTRFQQPDDKDIVYRCVGKKCENRDEIWNFYLRDEHLVVTFRDDAAARIEVIRR